MTAYKFKNGKVDEVDLIEVTFGDEKKYYCAECGIVNEQLTEAFESLDENDVVLINYNQILNRLRANRLDGYLFVECQFCHKVW